jgi:hypothetical protein
MCSNPVPSAADPKPAAPRKLSRQPAGFVFPRKFISYRKTTCIPYSATRNAGETFPSPTSNKFPSSGAACLPGEGQALLRVLGGGAEAVQLYTILIQSSCPNAQTFGEIGSKHKLDSSSFFEMTILARF